MAREAQLHSEADVYRELGRRLGGEPDATVWQLLERGRWPSDVLTEAANFEELLSEYREQLTIVGGRQRQPRSPVSEPQTASAPWATALAAIMALDAAKEPYVTAFRHEVLGDRLLAPEEVEAWRWERIKEAGGYTLITRPDMLGAVIGPRVNAWESQLAVEDYVGSGPPLEGRAAWELDFLDCLADVLMNWYGFHSLDSVRRFLLCDETPQLHAILAAGRSRERFHPGNDTIVMHVNPRCPPKQVLEIYSRARKRLLPERERIRQPDARDLALAVFVARVNDGRTWEDAAAAWNEAHEEADRYAEKRSFARDARGAYPRVVGTTLKWQGKGGAA